MNNLFLSLASLGEGIVNGLTGALGDVWYLVIVNIIGAFAIAVKIIETQNKKRRNIVFFAILNYLIWTTYFILYGDFTSAIVNCIGCIQAIIFLQREKHKWANSIFWLIFFLVVQIGAAVFTWKSPFSLFSIVAGLISTVAYFVLNEKIYRHLFLALILLWVGNGIVYFYPIALIHDVFAAISITIAIIRYNILGKDKIKKVEAEEQTTSNEDTLKTDL